MAGTDYEVVRVTEGAFDPEGNPFIALVYYGLDQSAYEDALELEGAKRVYLRSLIIGSNVLRIRFTAYDAEGRHITNSVCDSLRQSLKHEGYAKLG